MGEKATTNFALPYPTGLGQVKKGAIDFEELAKAVDTLLHERLLTKSAHSSSATVASGEFAQFTGGSNLTATLPAVATANQIVTIFNYLNAESNMVTVNAGTAKIYGDFVSAATTITLGYHQHVTLISDGGQWLIVAGEPRREATFSAMTAREYGTEYEPSASRPVEVCATCSKVASNGVIGAYVGGVQINEAKNGPTAGEATIALTFVVPPGKKWKVGGIAGSGLKSSYRVL